MRTGIPSAAAPLLVVSLALGAVVSAAAGADAPARVAGEQRGAGPLLELYALETDLGRARAHVDHLHAEQLRLSAEQAEAAMRLRMLRATLAASEAELSRVLRAAYESEGEEPLAVVLGSESLDDAIDRIEDLSSVAARTRSTIAQVGETRAGVTALMRTLASRSRALAGLEADARASADQLARTVERRAAYVASLGAGTARPAAAVRHLEQRARAAEHRSSGLDAAAPVRPAARPSQLTVDAVAYSLPGVTASGLPVGRGVAAVDPTVIPLGTRMFVPGYGDAVAADVGTAVKGLTIDLWFPTLAESRAWGRRTVTITLR